MSIVAVLSVEDIESPVNVDCVAGLLAVAILEGRIHVLGCLEPDTSVFSGIKVRLKLYWRALTCAVTGGCESDKGYH